MKKALLFIALAAVLFGCTEAVSGPSGSAQFIGDTPNGKLYKIVDYSRDIYVYDSPNGAGIAVISNR